MSRVSRVRHRQSSHGIHESRPKGTSGACDSIEIDRSVDRAQKFPRSFSRDSRRSRLSLSRSVPCLCALTLGTLLFSRSLSRWILRFGPSRVPSHEGTCCTAGNARRKTLATSPRSLARSFASSSLRYVVVVLVDAHPVPLYSFSHSSSRRSPSVYPLSISNTERSHVRTNTRAGTTQRARDVTHTDRATLSTCTSRAHRAELSKDSVLPFFRSQPSRNELRRIVRNRKRHGILHFSQRYTFVSRTFNPTNWCITPSLYPCPTRGPCVRFVSLGRDGTRSLSLGEMFCFLECTHRFFDVRQLDARLAQGLAPIVFTRATPRASLNIPPCSDVTFGGTLTCWRWRKPYCDRCS